MMVAHSNYVLYTANVGVSYEPESSWLLRSFVLHDHTVFEGAKLRKVFAELTLLQVVRKASNEYFSVLGIRQVVATVLRLHRLGLVDWCFRIGWVVMGIHVIIQSLWVRLNWTWWRVVAVLHLVVYQWAFHFFATSFWDVYLQSLIWNQRRTCWLHFDKASLQRLNLNFKSLRVWIRVRVPWILSLKNARWLNFMLQLVWYQSFMIYLRWDNFHRWLLEWHVYSLWWKNFTDSQYILVLSYWRLDHLRDLWIIFIFSLNALLLV